MVRDEVKIRVVHDVNGMAYQCSKCSKCWPQTERDSMQFDQWMKLLNDHVTECMNPTANWRKAFRGGGL